MKTVRLFLAHLRLYYKTDGANLSPVNKAALSFEAGFVHEHYTLFKVLSPVEHKEIVCFLNNSNEHIKSFREQEL